MHDVESIVSCLCIAATLFSSTRCRRKRARPPEELPRPRISLSLKSFRHIEDLMKEIISNATGLNPGNRRVDAKKAKMLAVQQMQERGIFLMKGGVEKAAEALGVTRYTIYNYLDELKNTDS